MNLEKHLRERRDTGRKLLVPYVTGGLGKEWIEVQAGSHRVVIGDFRSVQADGKTVWKGRPDKGHRAAVAAFRAAVAGGPAMPTEPLLATMRATIQAAVGTGGHD